MKDNGRRFLKQVSLAGVVALTMPQIISAKGKKVDYSDDAAISKIFLFQGDCNLKTLRK
jgi:hypothetical protein